MDTGGTARYPRRHVAHEVSSMPAYLFVKTKIHDREQYMRYVREVRQLREGHGTVHVMLAEALP